MNDPLKNNIETAPLYEVGNPKPRKWLKITHRENEITSRTNSI